jgi:hypothetical protein
MKALKLTSIITLALLAVWLTGQQIIASPGSNKNAASDKSTNAAVATQTSLNIL